jgi:hypothetical protein
LDFQVGERVGNALSLAAANLAEPLERLLEELVGCRRLALLRHAEIFDGKGGLLLGFGVFGWDLEQFADKVAGLAVKFRVHFFLLDGLGDFIRAQQAEIVF